MSFILPNDQDSPVYTVAAVKDEPLDYDVAQSLVSVEQNCESHGSAENNPLTCMPFITDILEAEPGFENRLSLDEELKILLSSVLFSVEEKGICSIVRHLIDVSGLETIDDVSFVNESDLASTKVLKPIQIRKILQVFSSRPRTTAISTPSSSAISALPCTSTANTYPGGPSAQHVAAPVTVVTNPPVPAATTNQLNLHQAIAINSGKPDTLQETVPASASTHFNPSFPVTIPGQKNLAPPVVNNSREAPVAICTSLNTPVPATLINHQSLSLPVVKNYFGARNTSKWAASFSIPWEEFPEEFLLACESKTEIPKPAMRYFIKVLSHNIALYDTKPGRRNFRLITSRIINRFQLGSNAEQLIDTIVRKLEHSFENLNRRDRKTKRKERVSEDATLQIEQCLNGDTTESQDIYITEPMKREDITEINIVKSSIEYPESVGNVSAFPQATTSLFEHGSGNKDMQLVSEKLHSSVADEESQLANKFGDKWCVSQWATAFNVPWESVSEDFLQTCKSHRPIKNNEMESFLDVVVRSISEHETKPRRANLRVVASKIVNKYPLSFGDVTDSGQLMGDGCFTLLRRLEQRFDNPNHRVEFLRRLKRRFNCNNRSLPIPDSPLSAESELLGESRASDEQTPNELNNIEHDTTEMFANPTFHQDFIDDSNSIALRQSFPGCSAVTSESNSSTFSDPCVISTKLKRKATLWSLSFEIPWEKFPKEFNVACRLKNPIPNRAMKRFLNVLFEAISDIDLNPGRSNLRVIASKIVHLYPHSLADRTDGGELVGDGCLTLVKRLENRFDNLKRKAQAEASSSEEGVNLQKGFAKTRNVKQKCAAIVAMQPNQLSEDIERLQEVKKMWLIEEFEKSQRNSELVIECMSATYISQRNTISNNKPIVDILREWPFLREPALLFDHYQTLMGVSVHSVTDELNKKGDKLIRFLQAAGQQNHKSSPKLKSTAERLADILLKRESSKSLKYLALIPLLLAYFDESETDVVITCKDTDSLEEVLKRSEFPPQPVITIYGSFSEIVSFAVIIEQGLMQSTRCWFTALEMLLASYFIFNIPYPQAASCTLEFLQRCFLKVGQEKSLKPIRKCNPKVVALMNALRDFENDWIL